MRVSRPTRRLLAFSRLAGLVLVFDLFLAPAVQAGSGFEPGGVVEVDLRNAAVSGTLPFDVPFFLEGTVDVGVEHASFAWNEFTAPQNCDALAWPLTFENASVRDQVDNTGKVTGRVVRVSLPELKPKRFFCFWFELGRTATPEALAAFRAEAAKLYAAAVASLATADPASRDVLSRDRFNELRQNLIRLIAGQAGPGQRIAVVDADGTLHTIEARGRVFDGSCSTAVAPPAGSARRSFFDPDACLTDIDPQALDTFTEILETQARKTRFLANLGTAEDRAVDALRALRTSGDYQRLVQAIQQHRGNDLVETLLGGNESVLAIADWAADGSTEELVARGFAADGSGRFNLDANWDATVVETARQRITELQQTLTALAAMVDRLERSEPFRNALELGTSVDLAALDQTVEAAEARLAVVNSQMARLSGLLGERTQAIATFVATLQEQELDRLAVFGSSLADFKTRANWYVSADLGLGWAPEIEEVFGYAGSNIYFRPVNKAAPLKGWGRGEFLKRFSIMVGTTDDTGTPQAGEGERGGILGTMPLLLAGGVRLSDHFRMSLGAYVFEEDDPSPVITESEITVTPYLAFSVDWDVASLFKNLGGPFANSNGGNN